MTQAEQEIADLDFALANDGQTVTLRRLYNGAVLSSVECKAFVRGYTPDQYVGAIAQQEAKVIMSPTQIIASGWPSPPNSPPDSPVPGIESRIPVKGDKIVVAGRPINVEAAVGIYVSDVLVRIEARIKG